MEEKEGQQIMENLIWIVIQEGWRKAELVYSFAIIADNADKVILSHQCNVIIAHKEMKVVKKKVVETEDQGGRWIIISINNISIVQILVIKRGSFSTSNISNDTYMSKVVGYLFLQNSEYIFEICTHLMPHGHKCWQSEHVLSLHLFWFPKILSACLKFLLN